MKQHQKVASLPPMPVPLTLLLHLLPAYATSNETPMVRGLTADNNKKLYTDYDLLME